jgi:phosphatidylserine decarboxylase
VPFAREGYPLIGGGAALAAVLFLLGWTLPAWLAVAITVFIISFFRDPERQVPAAPDCIVAPADGRVVKIARVQDDRFLKSEATLISIFMSPLDVHVNRVPAAGRVLEVHYHPGKYFRAFADKASLDNEQNAILMEDERGRRLCFVQIAGFLARRIVCYLRVGMQVERGQRCGMIMFGSRADVYLPTSVAVRVKVGDHARGGLTVLAEWS